MTTRYLYFVAAALALAAAVIYLSRAQPGEDVTVRVVLLAVLGAAMIVFGLRKPARPLP